KFIDAQPLYFQLANLERVDTRFQDRETAYRHAADRKRADRKRADRKRAGGVGANSNCGGFQFFSRFSHLRPYKCKTYTAASRNSISKGLLFRQFVRETFQTNVM